MTTREPENPLIIHCMILFAVALGSVGYGVWGLIQSIQASKSTATTTTTTSSSGNAATDASRKVSDADRAVSQTSQDAQQLGRAPTLSGAATQIQAAGRLAAKAKAVFAYLVPALFIAAGLAMAFAAVKVLGKSDWARLLALGSLAAVLCGFAAIEGGRLAAANAFTWQIAVVGVGALLAGWIGWNLAVEKFEEAPGVPAVLGFAILPLLIGGVGAPLYVVSNAPEKPATGTKPAAAAAEAPKEEVKADKYSWKNFGVGTTVTLKIVNPTSESTMRFTLLDKGETKVKLKMEGLGPDGKPTFTIEQEQDLAFAKGDDEEFIEEKSDTIEVPAGKYTCEYKKVKKKVEDKETISELWLHEDSPMVVKSISGEGPTKTTIELVSVERK